MSGLNARLHPTALNITALENPQEFFNCIIDRCKERVNVMLPCRIEKYDRSTHLADLRILFDWKMTDGDIVQGEILHDITIHRLQAGGFLIDFPISIGDTGWIFASDRDAYDSKLESAPRLPPTPYCNSYASGFWIPDQWGSGAKLGISGLDDGCLMIQNLSGTQKIGIGQQNITITASEVIINSNVIVNGSVTASGTIKESGTNVTLGGHTHISSQAGTDTSAPNAGT